MRGLIVAIEIGDRVAMLWKPAGLLSFVLSTFVVATVFAQGGVITQLSPGDSNTVPSGTVIYGGTANIFLVPADGTAWEFFFTIIVYDTTWNTPLAICSSSITVQPGCQINGWSVNSSVALGEGHYNIEGQMDRRRVTDPPSPWQTGESYNCTEFYVDP